MAKISSNFKSELFRNLEELFSLRYLARVELENGEHLNERPIKVESYARIMDKQEEVYMTIDDTGWLHIYKINNERTEFVCVDYERPSLYNNKTSYMMRIAQLLARYVD